MKKIFKITLCISLVLFLYACSNKNIKGTLEDIMSKLYEGIEELPMALTNFEINEENVNYYIGTDKIEFEEAIASESMNSSIAHSVVLLRVKDGVDIDEAKKIIKDNINLYKWICVGVEKAYVESKGDLILIVLNDSIGENIKTNFESL